VRFRDRGGRVPADVLARADLPRGEKVLAHTVTNDDTWLLGTRLQLVIVETHDPDAEPAATHIPWETVEDAAWDRDDARLRVTEIGRYGAPRPMHSFTVEDPALLLQLIRERVTASIVLQRRVPVRGKLGLTVIARRSPVGGPVAWMHAYDEGVDPTDPEVVAVADHALAQAQTEVGEPADGPALGGSYSI
jgi:hypothetical protein